MLAKAQHEDKAFAGNYNFGPDDESCVTTGELATLFCTSWGNDATWTNVCEVNAPHEANFLKLDNTKIKETFGWNPTWNIEKAIEKTVQWINVYLNDEDIVACVNNQIDEFFYKKQ